MTGNYSKTTGNRNRKNRKKIMLLLLVFLLVIFSLFSACKQNDKPKSSESISQTQKYVYFVNRDKTKIKGEEFAFFSDDIDDEIQEMITALSEGPSHNELKTSLGVDYSILSYEVKEETLVLNMDEKYNNQKPTDEILARASLVRSFTQIDGIDLVAFLVEGETLLDANGVAVGFLSADSFIDNDGKEINAYEKVSVTLYFATEDGKNLIAGQRKVVYNTNISMEKMVVEQLIKGPQLAGYYPTINPETKVLSVTNKDGTCYVNLSEDFLKQPYDVSNDVTIYSIANSLIDLSTVNRVQIQVNGSSKVSYRETTNLEDTFERNLDLVIREEE